MALSSVQQNSLFKLTVGLFNAAPGSFYTDVEGIIIGSQTEAQAAQVLIDTPAFQAILPSKILTNAQFSAKFVDMLVGSNATAANKTWAAAQVEAQLNGGATQGAAAWWAIDALSNVPTSNADWGTAAAALNNKLDVAKYFTVDKFVASKDVAALQGLLIDVTADAATVAVAKASAMSNSINLSTNVETTNGTAGADLFKAFLSNGANTLQSGDVIRGGAGVDTLMADVSSQNRNGEPNENAIAFESQSVEKVTLRSQHQESAQNNGDNNLDGATKVAIDAERAASVGTWTDYNSRADLIIEDVRIADGLKTKDVTLVMESTDPGNVDFGVYFDQHSLRNSSSQSTTLTVKLMDTGAAGNAATAATPLLNNPYDQFKLGLNGVLTTIQLDKTAVAAADTYAALLTVFQNALASTAGVTVALGNTFTITDPISNKAVTGQEIVLTGSTGIAISAPAGSGWYNTTGASVPPTSNIYTTYSDASTSVAELVTSTIVLDDVGRGSTGGDLLVGGLSVGETSTSRGVERFEIEVRDSSKLQTINSTNNALREVTIVSGATTNTTSAYNTVVANEGDLTVNGNAKNALGADQGVTAANQTMDGANENAVYGTHQGANAAGFTDVRLIDASAFKGKLAFTAAITGDSIDKYVNLVDTAANPTADVAGTGNVNFNVKGANFIYTGGIDNDTIAVTIDGGVASSRSNVVAGQSDFTFNVAGGTGNDAITLSVIDSALAGGAQHWYNNQKLNANIWVNGGDGNDTIRTPGAGDVFIDAGNGDDTVYTDNTGALTTATANGAATAAAIAYTNAAAAELAAAQAARVLANNTGFVTSDGVAVGTFISATAQVAALATLDQITPTNPPALPAITHLTLANGTAAAAAAGAITLAQKVALDAAYGSATGGVVTPAVGVGGPSTIVGAAAGGGNVTAPALAAGDALLATYIAAAKANAAIATAADANVAVQNALLNATQTAVANAYMALNGVENNGNVATVEIGTANIVAGLATLRSTLVAGTTQAAAVAAIDAAHQSGVLTAAGTTSAAVLAAVGAGAMDAVDAAAVVALLSPLQNTAAINNATAQATYTAALAADATAVNTAAGQAAADPVLAAAAVVANDAVGSTEAAAAALAAANASAAAAVDLAASQAINTALAGLKTAVNVGSLDADVNNAVANANAAIVAAIATSAATGTGAVAVNPLGGGVAAALIALAGVPSAAVNAAEELAFDTGALGVYNANSVDSLIMANTVQTDALTIVAANAAATAAATATASTIATAAANSGAASLTVSAPKAVYVFDTSNQAASYNKATMDDRNLADLKSDVNNTNNFFNSTVKVTYKGLDASVVVAGTGYKTTDLEINQAIKQAINTDAVLSKLLVATDGPANSLVVTSLIDGVHTTGNLAVTVTLPTAVTLADVAGAATAYGLAAGATDAQVLAAMTASKTAFDAKGDYTTQFAESGAAAGNVTLTGANSVSSSDNTVTPGTGNDVIVLGTTVGTDAMTSSNEVVVYSGSFGNDTIVNFAATGLGADVLNFAALGGRGTTALNSLSLDKSIVIATEAATPLTTTQIAALFTDSATAISHVYVAYNTNNIGSVYMVADAAGTAAGNVTATLVGTIDLADTGWATLTAANFG